MTDRAIKLVFILTCLFFVVGFSIKAAQAGCYAGVDCTHAGKIRQFNESMYRLNEMHTGDTYTVPRYGGGYTEVYPGGTITNTPNGFGGYTTYRDGYLPPSRY